MKKYLFTGLALFILMFAHAQNSINGAIYIGGVMSDASGTSNTTLLTGGSITVDATGTWLFNDANVVTPRTSATQAETISFNTAATTFSRTTGFVNGYAATVTPAINFVLPIGQATYMPITFTAASPATVQAAWYDAGAASAAIAGGTNFMLNPGFYDLNSSAAGSTVTVAAPTGLPATAHILKYVSATSTFTDLGLVSSTPIATLPISASKIFFGTPSVVSFAVKLFLQANMTNATTMRNSLQLQNKLLLTSPFTSAPATFNGINNTLSAAGQVADWILVSVINSSTKAVLETKSLLLKTDGTIVDINGAVPVFMDQSGTTVRVIFQPRNHMRVATNNFVTGTNAFTGTINYDFSTGAGQAYKGTINPQQILTYGVFSLVAGDNLHDDSIDIGDFNKVDIENALGTSGYILEDLNMDGSVDIADFNWVDSNAGIGYYFNAN